MTKKLFFLLSICIFCSYASFAWGAARGQINSGETRIGLSISGPSFLDTWTFNGSIGERVIINAVKTTGNLDTYITLYPPGGGSAEASTWAWGDQLDHQLKQTGLYTIVIQDYGLNDAGTYDISFLKIPGAVSSAGDPDGGAMASGQTLSGSTVPSDLDGFQFYGNTGERVIINAVKTTGNLDTYITLYPPGGGSAEASTWAWGDQLDHQLKQTGLYTIVIQDYGLNDAGTYDISFLKIPGAVSSAGDPDGGAIASGQTLSGSTVPSDLDGFQFYGNTEERVIINAVKTTGNLDTYITLYPPGGGPAEASTWAWGDQLDHQLKQTGLYTIVIQDYQLNDAGGYNISLTKIPSELPPGIYNPSPANGAIVFNATGSFGWDAVSGATGYDLYFGEDVIVPLVKIGDNLTSPSMPFPTMETGKIYYWHVVAHTTTGDVEGPYWWFSVDLKPCDGEVKTVETDTGDFELLKLASKVVTVTVTDGGSCPVADVKVSATIKGAGKKRIGISPSSETTDENGKAVFTITAKEKSGKAKVRFKTGGVTEQITVTVVK